MKPSEKMSIALIAMNAAWSSFLGAIVLYVDVFTGSDDMSIFYMCWLGLFALSGFVIYTLYGGYD